MGTRPARRVCQQQRRRLSSETASDGEGGGDRLLLALNVRDLSFTFSSGRSAPYRNAIPAMK